MTETSTKSRRRFVPLAVLLLAAPGLSGCIIGSVAGAAVDVTVTAVDITTDVVGGAVDLAIPDGDDDEDEKKKKDKDEG